MKSKLLDGGKMSRKNTEVRDIVDVKDTCIGGRIGSVPIFGRGQTGGT